MNDKTLEKVNMYDNLKSYEKLEVLREFVEIEIQYLGIMDEYNIIMSNLEETCNGYFDVTKNVIVIDEKVIEDETFSNALITCFHEVYHLYQYEIMECLDWDNVNSDLLMLREITEWRYESQNYKTPGNSSYDEYANQLMEVSARNYAEEMVSVYMEIIEGR